LTDRYGIHPGSINPNLFQDQIYKFDHTAIQNASVRSHALQHTKDSIEIAKSVNSRDIFDVVRRWIELSRNGKYSAAQSMVENGLKRSSLTPLLRPALAGGIQAFLSRPSTTQT